MSVDILDLPPPSPVLSVLLARIDDPRHTLRDLTEVIRLDPGLTAAVLKLSNSALYARRGSLVGTIDDAVLRIGESDLIRIVVGRMSRWIADSDTDGYGLARENLWKRALMCAIAADEIARRTDQSPGIAFTTGLLLDIGKIALGRPLATQAAAVQTHLDTHPDESFDVAEGAVLGEDHAETGARLAEAWRFPEVIVAAIRYHHRPTEAPRMAALVALSHVADIIAMQCGAPVGVDDLRYSLEEEAVQALGLADHVYDAICTHVSARFQRERALFDDDD